MCLSRRRCTRRYSPCSSAEPPGGGPPGPPGPQGPPGPPGHEPPEEEPLEEEPLEEELLEEELLEGRPRQMTQGNEAWRVCNTTPGCRSVWYRPWHEPG